MKPTFSIILPCWNSINYIERCIVSLKQQSYTNYEAIVIDNSSTDGTVEKINEIKDERFKVFSIKNKGILAKSRNLGISKAEGEWIAFLDSDDWWTNDKLIYCNNFLNNNNVDFIYHDLEIKSNKPRLLKRKKNRCWQLKKPILINLLIDGNIISNSSVIVKKELLKKIGGIDENRNLPASEDYNAWLRIAKFTDKFAYIQKNLYYFLNDQGMSNKDMSISGRHAVNEFFEILNRQQKMKVEANLKYQSGRYNFQNLNFKKAKKDLFFVIKNGNITLKIRAYIMNIIMNFR